VVEEEDHLVGAEVGEEEEVQWKGMVLDMEEDQMITKS